MLSFIFKDFNLFEIPNSKSQSLIHKLGWWNMNSNNLLKIVVLISKKKIKHLGGSSLNLKYFTTKRIVILLKIKLIQTQYAVT